jgi:hypothetical protein
MSGGNRRALRKGSLKVVYNEKHGLSARCLLLLMSMGHWRSRFVSFKNFPSSFLQRISVSAKYRRTIS